MTQDRPQQAQMDPIQQQKMTESMSHDLREAKKQLLAFAAEKEKMMADKEARDIEYERLNKDMSVVKEEKKRNFSEVVDKDVTPFFQSLRKDQDPRLVENVDMIEQQIATGLNDAFMNANDMALFQTVRAASSAMTATSAELERMFQSDRAWADKFAALQKEKDDVELKNQESLKSAVDERELKEKAMEALQEELEKIKAVHSKNLSAVENHFDGDAAVATTESDAPVADVDATAVGGVPANSPATPIDGGTTTVRAEASSRSTKYLGGWETLFDFKPKTCWRDNRRSDGF